MNMDYLIIDSGLTGAVIARTLTDAGKSILLRILSRITDAFVVYVQSDCLGAFSVINTVANRAGTQPRGTTLLEFPWCIIESR